MTERDRKVADNPQVIKLTTDALVKKTKDLQIAAWLTGASLKQKGFPGLRDGLLLCHGLIEKFWDTLYPELEDGDAQTRAAPLGFLGTKLDIPVSASVRVHRPSWSTTGADPGMSSFVPRKPSGAARVCASPSSNSG